MAESSGSAAGLSRGLIGGISAGTQLNRNAIDSRDNALRGALTLRGQQIDIRRQDQEKTSKAQAKMNDTAKEIVEAFQNGLANGDESVVARTRESVKSFVTRPVLAEGIAGPSPADTLESQAGLEKGSLSQKLNLLLAVTPGQASAATGAGMIAGAQRGATLEADLAAAPRTRDAAAAQAGAVAGATETGQVNAQTALSGDIAANAARTTAANQAATPSTIAKLQRDREAANAEGRAADAAEITAQIAALGDPTGQLLASDLALGPKEIRKAADDLVELIGAADEVGQMQDMFEDTPLAAGALGAGFEWLSGVTAQIGNLVGSDLSLPGDAKVTAARTKARLVVDNMLKALAEAKRTSQVDRDNVKAMQRALEGDASAQQVYTASKEILKMMTRQKAVAADKLLTGLELTSDEGVEAAGARLLANGVPRSKQAQIIMSVRDRRR